MKIYNYDKNTFEFLSASEAKINPIATARKGKNVYLCPAYATFDEPNLTPQENKCFVYKDNKWQYTDDFRGQRVFNKQTKEGHLIDTIGAIHDGFTIFRPKDTDDWDSEQNKWVANVRSAEIKRIKTDYNNAISTGFSYPFGEDIILLPLTQTERLEQNSHLETLKQTGYHKTDVLGIDKKRFPNISTTDFETMITARNVHFAKLYAKYIEELSALSAL
jgi:hypothetical protein